MFVQLLVMQVKKPLETLYSKGDSTRDVPAENKGELPAQQFTALPLSRLSTQSEAETNPWSSKTSIMSSKTTKKPPQNVFQQLRSTHHEYEIVNISVVQGVTFL